MADGDRKTWTPFWWTVRRKWRKYRSDQQRINCNPSSLPRLPARYLSCCCCCIYVVRLSFFFTITHLIRVCVCVDRTFAIPQNRGALAKATEVNDNDDKRCDACLGAVIASAVPSFVRCRSFASRSRLRFADRWDLGFTYNSACRSVPRRSCMQRWRGASVSVRFWKAPVECRKEWRPDRGSVSRLCRWAVDMRSGHACVEWSWLLCVYECVCVCVGFLHRTGMG